MKIWVCDIYSRIYPQTPVGNKRIISLLGSINERQAFQVAVRNESVDGPLKVSVTVDGPKELKIRMRRIGYVPLPQFNTPIMEAEDCEGLGYVPGYVPDPLFDENTATVPPQQTHAFWIDVTPKTSAKPGKYQLEVIISQEGNKRIQKVRANVEMADVKLKPRKNFRVTNWFYTDAIIDRYKTDGYDERCWELLAAYMKNLADHGQDTILTPIFTPPLDGVKTPCQLLKVKKLGGGKYKFDFSAVKRFVNLAKKCGLKYFEWSHLVTQWGAEFAIRIYEGQGKTRKLLWKPETKATSKTYKNFLSQLLPAWYDFMKENRLLAKSFFHLSDEPNGEEHLANYRGFRELLWNLAPWMKVMDACNHIEFAQSGLTDMPVASELVVMNYIKENISRWVYYCSTPRGKFLNHLMDTPLAKIAMHGLLFYRWHFGGFLHWGYNFWYRRHTTQLIDPFSVSDAGDWPLWPHGDTFMVYPGEDGPIDSIRWEVFSLAMQDYQLLQTLGVSREDKCLAAIQNFEEFPKDANWRLTLRKKLLKQK